MQPRDLQHRPGWELSGSGAIYRGQRESGRVVAALWHTPDGHWTGELARWRGTDLEGPFPLGPAQLCELVEAVETA